MNPKDHSEKHKKEAKHSDAEGEISVSKAEYEALQAKVTELEAMREKMMRVAADFENAKKRLARERDDFLKFSQENLILQLLPVLDNFERALAHAGSSEDPNNPLRNVIAGVQLVFKQLTEILKKQGLVRLETAGKMLDPHIHEAVGHVEGPGKEDEIVEEVEPGYLLHDKLLRAAKVRIRASSGEKQEEIT